MRIPKKALTISAVVSALYGCTMAPKYVRPEAPIPATLPSGAAYGSAPATAPAIAATDLPWQEFFTDQRLAKIISSALRDNRDLRIAILNVDRFQALYGIQRAQLAPILNANAGMSRQKIPAGVLNNDNARITTQYNANLAVSSWEIDLFGRTRSLADAALQNFFATQQARRSAQLSLISSVATAYLTLAADRDGLSLAQTTLQAQQDSFDLVSKRYQRGLAPQLDVQRAQTQVDTARRSVAVFTQRVAQDKNELDLLTGSPVPDELLPEGLERTTPPREIAAGLSSQVLLQRPDILQAEDQLKAANANIGAARAAFFPSITLTAAAGTASSELSGLFKPGSGTWIFNPQISMPIFDPRTWSAIKLTKADQKIAIAQYEKAIQTGFREVADVLAIRANVGAELAAQESLVHAFAETYRLSSVRYDKGVDSYLSVLDAQRSLYAAQQELVFLRLSSLNSQVRLYSALGGGAIIEPQ